MYMDILLIFHTSEQFQLRIKNPNQIKNGNRSRKERFFFSLPTCEIAPTKSFVVYWWINWYYSAGKCWVRKAKEKAKQNSVLQPPRKESFRRGEMQREDGKSGGGSARYQGWMERGEQGGCCTTRAVQQHIVVDHDSTLTLEVFHSLSLPRRIFPRKQAQAFRHTCNSRAASNTLSGAVCIFGLTHQQSFYNNIML